MFTCFFFLMIRRPPRSTLDRSSAASDVYKRQTYEAVLKLGVTTESGDAEGEVTATAAVNVKKEAIFEILPRFTGHIQQIPPMHSALTVSYTHLRAHETVLDLVCRLLLETKHNKKTDSIDSLN